MKKIVKRKKIQLDDLNRVRVKGVGPSVPAENLENIYISSKKRIPVVALMLAPGINRTSGYISFLNMILLEVRYGILIFIIIR